MTASAVPVLDWPAGATRSPKVAVIGTGTMGAAMVRRLLTHGGLSVDVWNRTPQRARDLAGSGAEAHATPAQAAAAADVVITMLPDGAAVRQVAFRDGMLAALRPGAVWVQMGTIGVTATAQLAASAADRRPDVLFVDAPVSGSRAPAETGTLLILASGPDQARDVLEPVFAAIGKRTMWLGPAGAGSRLKLVLNTWLAFLVEGIAETAALADTLGVSHDDMAGALAGGPLDATLALAKLAKIDSGDESADFSLRWALKDVDLALDLTGRRLPAANAISRHWGELVHEGLGDNDVSAARRGLG
jgi:3-hydroxyisobutyrate dehydrogenase